MKPAILIQTDFSQTWSGVAQMKGVMKIVDPSLEIIDLCHDIKQFDPWEASLSLEAAEPYWPKGTIFVSVIDPGVGTSRRACAAKLKDGNIVFTPDNGSLTHLLHSVGIEEVRRIDEETNRYHDNEQVSVFHGRDLFGYCAARLAAGLITFEEVGPSYPVSEIVECEEFFIEPVCEKGFAEGFIMTGTRHFGGITLNIRNDQFHACGFEHGNTVRVVIIREGREMYYADMAYVPSFGFGEKGEPLIYEGSSGHICIDINQGNFMEENEIGIGREWIVRIVKGQA